MGTNLGDIPESYPEAEQQAVAKTTKTAQEKAYISVRAEEADMTLPNLRNISPSSFFELKREFLKLSESYIARFIARLDAMRDEYENDDSERKIRELFTSKKLGNSIGYEQYLYYSTLLKQTNLIYRERVASAVFASKDTFDLFYFQVHFAYRALRKGLQEESGETTAEKSSPRSKIEKLVETIRTTSEYASLTEKERKSFETAIRDKMLFGLRVHNAEAFNNGLQSVLFLYFRTGNELFVDFYEKSKQSFWIQKNDFVDFLGENHAFLLWIHILLDTSKYSAEATAKEKERFLASLGTAKKSSTKARNTETAKKVRDFRTLLENRESYDSFRMSETDSPFAVFSSLGEKDEPLMKDIIRYIQAGAFFSKCRDLLYKRNDSLFAAKKVEGIYFNDLRKYFRTTSASEGPTMSDIIVQLSKHTLYFYLYPIFLYSIAKKVQLSQNDFRILQDSGALMSTNVEDFLIVSAFYRDLDQLIGKDRNLGLHKASIRGFFFHMKQWGIPLVTVATACVLFALFFRFPLYFAALGVVYTGLYIMSEYLLSYKLRILRVVTGYAMLALFLLLGGFNINYQQVATERLAQAHDFLRTGTGSFDMEKAMVQMGTMFENGSMKTNLGESGSGGVKK